MIGLLPGDCWKVLVPGEHTNGRFALLETHRHQGKEPPRHVHSREDELVYVLDGLLRFDLEGERFDGPAGSLTLLPRGREHAFTLVTPEARLLVLLSPAGLERCLEDLTEPDVSGTEQQLGERLIATAARYGVAITGPALTAGTLLANPPSRGPGANGAGRKS